MYSLFFRQFLLQEFTLQAVFTLGVYTLGSSYSNSVVTYIYSQVLLLSLLQYKKAYTNLEEKDALQTQTNQIRLRSTLVLALRRTTRTSITRSTTLRITETKTYLGIDYLLASLKRNLYTISTISQAITLLAAQTTRSPRRPRSNLHNKTIINYQTPVPSLLDQAQRRLRPWTSLQTLTIL